MIAKIKTYVIFPLISILIGTLIGVLITLILAELVLRALGLGYGNLPHEYDSVLHHIHLKNYRFVSHTPTGEYGGHAIYYDESGLISNPEHLKKNTGKQYGCRVAFLGDSFTEAAQVAYQDSFVGILEQASNEVCEVKNFGVMSYSPILYVLQWKHLVSHFHPTHVIVLLYSNDIAADQKYHREALYSKGQLKAVPGPVNDWIVKLSFKSYLVRFSRKMVARVKWILNNHNRTTKQIGGYVEENPDISELSSKFMMELSKNTHESGANFVLMVVPSKYRLFNRMYNDSKPQFSDKWKKWSHDNTVHFIDLVMPFEHTTQQGHNLFFSKDIHLNEKGHKVVAKAVKDKFPTIFSRHIP